MKKMITSAIALMSLALYSPMTKASSISPSSHRDKFNVDCNFFAGGISTGFNTAETSKAPWRFTGLSVFYLLSVTVDIHDVGRDLLVTVSLNSHDPQDLQGATDLPFKVYTRKLTQTERSLTLVSSLDRRADNGEYKPNAEEEYMQCSIERK